MLFRSPITDFVGSIERDRQRAEHVAEDGLYGERDGDATAAEHPVGENAGEDDERDPAGVSFGCSRAEAIAAVRASRPSKLFLLPWNPTAENMARYFYDEVGAVLKRETTEVNWKTVLVGIPLLFLINMIPLVGFLVNTILFLAVFGGIYGRMWTLVRREQPTAPPEGI